MPQKVIFNEKGEVVNEQGVVVGKKDSSGKISMYPQEQISNIEQKTTNTPDIEDKKKFLTKEKTPGWSVPVFFLFL